MIKQRLLLWAICFGLLAFVAWAYFFKIGVAATMMGEVVPSGQVKKVQHLEGGIVARILVKEGQSVKEGEALIELSSASSDADVQELKLRIVSLEKDAQRYQALLNGAQKLTDGDREGYIPADQIAGDDELTRSQWQNYQAKVEEQQQLLTLNKINTKAEERRVQLLGPRLGYIKEQVKISEKLMKKGLSNRFEHLNLLKEANSVQAEISASKSSIEKAKAILAKDEMALHTLISDQNTVWTKELIAARKQLAELNERLNKFVDSQSRTVVRAPVSGTVFNLYVHNQGAVIPPGGMVATIVPENDTLLIEAKMMISDVGYVKIGQDVKLQLVSDVSAGYRILSGEVVYISADVINDQQQAPPYYMVRIKPAALFFTSDIRTYPLLPGVAVQATVLTGERSLFAYFVNPIFQNFSSAFTEL